MAIDAMSIWGWWGKPWASSAKRQMTSFSSRSLREALLPYTGRPRETMAVANIAGAGSNLTHNCTVRSRKALPITDTELKLMAALAIIGLNSNPNTGNRTPAAMGTPRML